MTELIINFLKTKAEAKKAQALLTLKGFNSNFAAIGDHTTGDLYNNLDEAYRDYLDALDELSGLNDLTKDLK